MSFYNKFNLDFYYDWTDKKQIEIYAFESLKQGLEVIFKNIEEKNIYSVYLKGSFLRREMNSKSDVDVSVILKEDEDLLLLTYLNREYKEIIKPKFEFTGYSLNELKTSKFSNFGKVTRPSVARFTRLIHSMKLIYGNNLETVNLYQKNDLVILKNVIKTFENLFLPNYQKRKINFQDLLKQVLWLIELEVSIKNKNFKFDSWNNLKKYLPKSHILFTTLKLRNSDLVSQEEKNKFILKLKKHLTNLRNYTF